MIGLAINWVMGSSVGRTTALVFGVLLALFLGGKYKERQGVMKERRRAKQKDIDHAKLIRSAGDAARAKRVRETDIVYRD